MYRRAKVCQRKTICIVTYVQYNLFKCSIWFSTWYERTQGGGWKTGVFCIGMGVILVVPPPVPSPATPIAVSVPGHSHEQPCLPPTSSPQHALHWQLLPGGCTWSILVVRAVWADVGLHFMLLRWYMQKCNMKSRHVVFRGSLSSLQLMYYKNNLPTKLFAMLFALNYSK